MESSTQQLTVAGFCGSVRHGSLNQGLLDAAAHIARSAGHRVKMIDLRDYPLPLFNQDLEDADGVPADVAPIHAAIAASDAVLIASPEYNGGYTPVFKNTIDWISRIDHLTFFPKYLGLLCATPGGKAGVRGLAQMEQLFRNIFVTVHAPSFGLGNAGEALAQGNTPGLQDWVEEYLAKAAAHAADPPSTPA